MRVILAIDGSAHSHAAVAAFAAQPWPKGTQVEILTAIHPSIPLFMDVTLVLAAAHVEQENRQLRQAPELLEAARNLIRDAAPAVTVTTRIVEGVPADMIVREANEWDADLVVVGSHGHGRVRRLVLGSVASAVVARAPCSVLVVRAKHLLPDQESAA
jgi:nucleotide-binding universal stress UspA family protein